MMGRLKTIISQVRNADMLMTEKTIKYSIPIHTEKGMVGMFRCIEVCDDEIKLFFDTQPVQKEKVKESPLKIENTANVVEFH